MFRPGPTTDSGHRSQKKGAQVASDRSDAHIAHIDSFILQQDHLPTFFNSAHQRLSALEEVLHALQVEKSALIGNIDFQAGETKKMKAGGDTLVNVILEQDRENESDRKRFKRVDIYVGLDLPYVGVASKMMKTLSARCGRKKWEPCLFDSVAKRPLAPRGGNVRHGSVAVSPASIISSIHRDFTGWFYQQLYSSDAEFLKVLVLQMLNDNARSEMLPFAKDQAVCVVGTALSKKLRVKLRHYLSDELNSRKLYERSLILKLKVNFLFIL